MTTEDLFAPLDLAVFERLANDSFRPVGRLPYWMKTPADGDRHGGFDLAALFPMLELFLPECELSWRAGTPEKLQSDIWTEPDYRDGEIYLQAVATSLGDRHFIVLRTLPSELFTYQQLAHELDLARDQVERLSRDLEVKRAVAERATQAKSDFLAAMSHEFRTPMNAILGMAEILSSTPLSPDQRRYVSIFQRNGEALLRLLNDILDLSKVEAGRMELEVSDMDVRVVLARALETAEPHATAKGLWLRQAVATDIPRFLTGDSGRLSQVITNLVGNAIKFTEHGGIEVRAEIDPENASREMIRFSIADTGIGISEDKLGMIFDSFSQAESSTNRRYGGTGLGLTISRQIVELMGGRIWVNSKIGSGSTFFFTARLPAGADQPERNPPAETSNPLETTDLLETKLLASRLLLVDDSEDNRLIVLSYLKTTGSLIDIAQDGRTGVELFRKGRYDAILMDIEMPWMDGYQAVREIRLIEQATGTSPVPVFAMTAHAFESMAAKAFEAGFTDLLTKPIYRPTLIARLAKWVQVPTAAQIESGMEDLVPRYLERRRAEVLVYRERLAADDFDAIQKLAHNMKGSGTGYGLPRLAELGGAIEEAASLSDRATLHQYLDTFARYLSIVTLQPKRPE